MLDSTFFQKWEQRHLERNSQNFQKSQAAQMSGSDFYDFINASNHLSDFQKLRLIENFEKNKGAENGCSSLDG
ncbi:hypothetical protein P7245_22270 [Vibrio parahaemolyticus]|nr:hypothetical protein [Vibrio parahaemolyticus]